MTAPCSQHLGPERGMLTDVYSPDRAAVASVKPGEVFVVQSLDSWGHLSPQESPGQARPVVFPARRGHCLVGPIEIRGARPGQHLAVHLLSLRPDPWGFTRSGGTDTWLNRRLGVADGPSAWLLWSIDAQSGTAANQHGVSVPLAPFLGVVGVSPVEPGEHSTVPPRTATAGNIDCRELTAGSTLYIPVAVEGALLFLGDGHAAQGDGEVGGTAIECGMTTELQVSLVEQAPVTTVHAVTPTSRITFGFSSDLNEAMGDALDAMLQWLQGLLSVNKAAALAIASATVDMRVTQVANGTWGVHAVLDHAAMSREAS